MTRAPLLAFALGWVGLFAVMVSEGPELCTRSPDVCAFERFEASPPTTASAAAISIAAMQDPVVRSAAVTRWLAVHPHTSALEGGGLCALLSPDQQRSCLRSVNSPHLRR